MFVDVVFLIQLGGLYFPAIHLSSVTKFQGSCWTSPALLPRLLLHYYHCVKAAAAVVEL